MRNISLRKEERRRCLCAFLALLNIYMNNLILIRWLYDYVPTFQWTNIISTILSEHCVFIFLEIYSVVCLYRIINIPLKLNQILRYWWVLFYYCCSVKWIKIQYYPKLFKGNENAVYWNVYDYKLPTHIHSSNIRFAR